MQARSQGEVKFKIIPASTKEEMSSNKKKVWQILTTHIPCCAESVCIGKAAHLVSVKRDEISGILCVWLYFCVFATVLSLQQFIVET